MNDVCLTGMPDGKPAEWKLDKDEFLIGRYEPADLVLPMPVISREHARITRSGRAYFIVDLNSRNGTFVNGEMVDQTPRRLINGDEIVLGGAVTLKFNDPSETMEGKRIGRLVGVWIDEATRDVWVDARRIDPPLSPAQFTLLKLLYAAPDRIITRDEIIAAVWSAEDPRGISEEAIDGLIKRLRTRLRETQPAHEYVQVVRGHGLRLLQHTE